MFLSFRFRHRWNFVSGKGYLHKGFFDDNRNQRLASRGLQSKWRREPIQRLRYIFIHDAEHKGRENTGRRGKGEKEWKEREVREGAIERTIRKRTQNRGRRRRMKRRQE